MSQLVWGRRECEDRRIDSVPLVIAWCDKIRTCINVDTLIWLLRYNLKSNR